MALPLHQQHGEQSVFRRWGKPDVIDQRMFQVKNSQYRIRHTCRCSSISWVLREPTSIFAADFSVDCAYTEHTRMATRAKNASLMLRRPMVAYICKSESNVHTLRV